MVVGGHQEKARYFGERANFHAGPVKEGGEELEVAAGFIYVRSLDHY
jgi:hypothetical protein